MLKISIIVPCYNQTNIDEALQSVLDQTYSNWECIIVNDGGR
jgi:glycosyltransferase involved in cell wall biosynthesis